MPPVRPPPVPRRPAVPLRPRPLHLGGEVSGHLPATRPIRLGGEVHGTTGPPIPNDPWVIRPVGSRVVRGRRRVAADSNFDVSASGGWPDRIRVVYQERQSDGTWKFINHDDIPRAVRESIAGQLGVPPV